MPNMSYCRFENTLRALRDCYGNINANLKGDEKEARRELILLCGEIASELPDEEAVLCLEMNIEDKANNAETI